MYGIASGMEPSMAQQLEIPLPDRHITTVKCTLGWAPKSSQRAKACLASILRPPWMTMIFYSLYNTYIGIFKSYIRIGQKTIIAVCAAAVLRSRAA